MHIIFGDEVAEQIRQKHLVLELETFIVEGKEQTAYCVVPPEAIAIPEMPDLDRHARIHQTLVEAWNDQRYDTVLEGISHLKGKFGGELDSFYEILQARIKEQEVVHKS